VIEPCERAANGLPILPLDLKCHRRKTNCLQSRVRTEDFYRRLMSEFWHCVESSFGSFANFLFFFTNFFIVYSRLYRQDAVRVNATISSELRMTGLGFFIGGSVSIGVTTGGMGDMSPQILEWGTCIHMSPQIFRRNVTNVL
jgi:hypothetical protein